MNSRGRCPGWKAQLAAWLWALVLPTAWAAERQTVCTITVNSPDEKETFRQWMPPSKYDFVELVERGRPDWLASACSGGLSCDVLIISGHYDGANEFFSDQLDSNEFLAVAELERASCSAACPGLFAKLKEVYLFGCNTLNPQPLNSSSAEVMRSLVRERRAAGVPRTEAPSALYGESGRDRMRTLFPKVPVIYGFSSFAPIGPVAATSLDRWLRSGGDAEAGQGRASRRLLAQFASFGLTSVSGVGDADELAPVRGEMCAFADERRTAARKLRFVHLLLQRDPARTWIHFDRMLRFAESLDDVARRVPDTAAALAEIERDLELRTRWLATARDIALPAERLRLLRLARALGWLSDAQWRDEQVLMLAELQQRSAIGLDEIELACTLNRDHELDGAFARRVAAGGAADTAAHAAVRACLGSSEAHARVVAGLLGEDALAARIAQAYLRQRPITDDAELRQLAAGIARMPGGEAQVRALESLGRHYLRDRDVLQELTRLFVSTPSAAVQVAIAGILIRADHRALGSAELARTLSDHRRPMPGNGGENLIDLLIRKLQAS